MLVFEGREAEAELMRASDQAYVVGQCVVCRDEGGLDGGTHTDVRSARDCKHRLVRHEAVDLYTDVTTRKVIVVVAVNRHSIRRQTKRVHRGGRQNVGMANRGRLRQIIEAALDRVQYVL